MTDDLRALAAKLLAASPHAMPIEEAEALIKARRSRLLGQAIPTSPPAQEPVTTPQPIPELTLNPEAFASAFWARRKPTPPPSKPKKRPGRKPKSAAPGVDRFTVIDGDAGDNEDSGR